MFGRDGLCFDTYFSACLTLFGEPPAGRPIAEVLGIEASARSRFQTAIDLAYSDDCTMPFDEIIAMAMAPRRIEQAGDRNIDVSYRPIRDFDDRLVSILVILTGQHRKNQIRYPPLAATGDAGPDRLQHEVPRHLKNVRPPVELVQVVDQEVRFQVGVAVGSTQCWSVRAGPPCRASRSSSPRAARPLPSARNAALWCWTRSGA